MNLGILGDDVSLIGAGTTKDRLSNTDWVTDVLSGIKERAEVKTLVTYDLVGVSVMARAIFNDVKRIVLTNVHYKTLRPLFSDIIIMDNDILMWTDYIVIIANGQRHSLYEKCRKGSVYEVNYLSRSQEWVKYGN